ncbi:MAG: outer membrane beta-barrel protein [Chryseolinea sp.]
MKHVVLIPILFLSFEYLFARFVVSEKFNLAFRGEYYQDEHGIIIATGTPNGLRTSGVSTNLDYAIMLIALWRIEARVFKSKEPVFQEGNDTTKTNICFTSSLAVSF